MSVADVRGKAVLVVGGTRGIGRAIAERFAEEGAEVGVTGRNAEQTSAIADSVAEAYGRPVSGHALDVANRAQIREVVEEFEAEHGGLDALVYNAGISPSFTSAEKIDEETWDAIIATNLTGGFVAAQSFARRLIEGGRPGSLVFIGSVDSVVGDPRLAAYTASKSGMAGMARTMAVDWARYAIRVNTVAPGYVATDLTAGLQQNERLRQAITDRTPMNRLAEPKEISDLVVFLASDSSTFITGAVYPVDGGWTAW
ncbi:MAG: SDR family oxidoreductase [Actinomycetota bacterium]|jgi:NAD(P)-dependent dehydrogenase (short-subunit alcohol dehydrogenase family)|nr:SDR family oxidoreductase [Actinomycetota bacterium]MDP9486007.1 SDR family oxidoreductase [Actinomycetota bacterium]